MKRRYTIHCPVSEIWVMEVDAESPEEALASIRNGGAWQTHAFSGTTKTGTNEIVEVRDLRDPD